MSMMVSPHAFAAGGASVPAYYTQEALGPTAESAGVLTTLLTMSRLGADFTPSATYVCFFAVDAESSAATTDIHVEVTAGATTVYTRNLAAATSTPLEKPTCSGMFLYSPGASPGAVDFRIKGNRVSSGTVTFTNMRLTILKLGTDEFSQENLAGGNTTSSTLQTADTFQFTPSSPGNYVILCHYDLTSAAITNSPMAVVSDGTTSVGQNNPGPIGANNQVVGTVVMIPITGASGLQTLTLKCRSVNNSTQVTWSNIRWVALRESRYNAVNKARISSDNSGTETSYTASVSQTWTPAAHDHLTLGIYGAFNTSATASVSTRFVDGGTTVNEQTIDMGRNNESLGACPAISHRLAAFAASSRTQTLDRLAESGTAGLRSGAAIVTLDLFGVT